jgi:iron only hydrogenase large subunit-like protein/uncharacterized Fe-S cluster-containing protein
MDNSIIQSEYVFTQKAACQDCYRCLKSCPVKAIKVKNGQAYIIEERCIHCNICIQNCAQNAISFKNDKDKFYELLDLSKKLNKKIVVSVAPSYSSINEKWERDRFPSALRRIGFDFVSGASVAANVVAQKSMEIIKNNPNKSYISSLCPTVINYVEKYRPDLIDYLLPVASPYLIHAKWLREKFDNNVIVVHIDSCVAKKMEILRPEFAGIVDLVLTFAELKKVFEEKNISLKTCEQSSYDELPVGNARLYQLVGGLSAVAGVKKDFLETDFLAVTGFQDIRNALDFVKTKNGILIEPLFCYKGCINGPGMHVKNNIFERNAEIIEYIKTRESKPVESDPLTKIEVKRPFSKEKILPKPTFTSNQIKAILAKTGSSDATKRPNCYSCGYPTCNEQAIAVLEGMAEVGTCIPYMRRFAESKASKIVESSPYGIVTLNEKYEVTSMNQAFRKFFVVTDTAIGKPISLIMDPEPFHKINNEEINILDFTIKHDKYGIVCHEVIYKLEDDNSYVGMFVNVTKNIADKSKLDELRKQTLKQAQELLSQQISMATGIAKILGDNTAFSESLLENLIKYTQGNQSQNENMEDSLEQEWLWNTNTSI